MQDDDLNMLSLYTIHSQNQFHSQEQEQLAKSKDRSGKFILVFFFLVSVNLTIVIIRDLSQKGYVSNEYPEKETGTRVKGYPLYFNVKGYRILLVLCPAPNG